MIKEGEEGQGLIETNSQGANAATMKFIVARALFYELVKALLLAE